MGLHCSKQQLMVAKCLVIIVCAVIDAVKGDTTAELYGKTRVHVKTLTSHIHVVIVVAHADRRLCDGAAGDLQQRPIR